MGREASRKHKNKQAKNILKSKVDEGSSIGKTSETSKGFKQFVQLQFNVPKLPRMSRQQPSVDNNCGFVFGL
jgi:hypothetical protein